MAKTEKIGERIDRLLRDSKLKQYQLAVHAGMHPASLNQIIKGHRTPKTATVTALADALGVTREYLLDGDAPPKPKETPADAEITEPVDLSAAIRAAVQAAIKDTLADIINAIAGAVAGAGESAAPAERESERPAPARRAAGRH